MARATAAVRPGFTGFAYGADAEMAQSFCDEMRAELGCEFTAVGSAEELCASAKVVFTQTPGSATVLERSMLQPGSTVIASGAGPPAGGGGGGASSVPSHGLGASRLGPADQAGVARRPARQLQVRLRPRRPSVEGGRAALCAGGGRDDGGSARGGETPGGEDAPLTLPTARFPPPQADVYAELGQVVNGDKPGREGDEIIVCDLTGTGAQDAAIGQVAWEKLSKL